MNVGIVGATGLVGTLVREIFSERDFPIESLRLFASSRSAGLTRDWNGVSITIEDASNADFSGLGIVVMSAGGDASRQLAPIIAKAGAKVIDNSSAWRMDDDVPLVVSEVNPHALNRMPKGIVANPNCTTMVAMPVLAPLHREFGLEKMIVSTYQSVSGSGGKGVNELGEQIQKVGDRLHDLTHSGGSVPQGNIYARPIAFNVIPLAGNLVDSETDEEIKFRNESRKILEAPEISVSCTCVRVPVVTGHSLSITASFARPIKAAEAQEILSHTEGVELSEVPTPLDVTGGNVSLVGRLREHPDDPQTLSMFICGDNLRKGAALNAVQLAELLANA